MKQGGGSWDGRKQVGRLILELVPTCPGTCPELKPLYLLLLILFGTMGQDIHIYLNLYINRGIRGKIYA